MKYVSVAHPRANRHVERAGIFLNAFRKRLYRVENNVLGRWMKELPAVVWGLRTQISCNTGVSPYFMVYRAEAILPADISFGCPRVKHFH